MFRAIISNPARAVKKEIEVWHFKYAEMYNHVMVSSICVKYFLSIDGVNMENTAQNGNFAQTDLGGKPWKINISFSWYPNTSKQI